MRRMNLIQFQRLLGSLHPAAVVEMQTITISLPEDHFGALKELAARFGVATEDLARAGVEDMLTRPDESFQQAIERLLNKNADLYQRLAAL